MFQRFYGKPVCEKHWKMDLIDGFDLKVALKIKE